MALIAVLVAIEAAYIPKLVEVCSEADSAGNQECTKYHVLPALLIVLSAEIESHQGFFTVLATAVIAVFTARLFKATTNLKDSTDKLWAAGERQLTQTQRAFVYLKDWKMNVILDASGSPKAWKLTPTWKNSGFTPAVGLTTNINWTMSLFAHPERDEYIYDKPRDVLVLGPKGIAGSRSIDIPADEIYPLREGLGSIYIWGRADYRDAFEGTAPHFAEYCVRVDIEVGHDPTNPYVVFIYVGPHNRTDDGQT